MNWHCLLGRLELPDAHLALPSRARPAAEQHPACLYPQPHIPAPRGIPQRSHTHYPAKLPYALQLGAPHAPLLGVWRAIPQQLAARGARSRAARAGFALPFLTRPWYVTGAMSQLDFGAPPS